MPWYTLFVIDLYDTLRAWLRKQAQKVTWQAA